MIFEFCLNGALLTAAGSNFLNNHVRVRLKTETNFRVIRSWLRFCVTTMQCKRIYRTTP